MRTYTVTLYANDGTSYRGASNAITAKVAEMGSLSWSLDEQLTKATPGDLTLKIWDEDGAVWTWLESNLGSTEAGTGKAQLFPPWIVVTTETSTPQFIGTVDPAGMSRDIVTNVIELAAKDWSAMLANIALEGTLWMRDAPKVSGSRASVGPWTGTADPVFYAYGVTNYLSFSLTDAAAIMAGVQQGDSVTLTGTPSGTFKVAWVDVLYSGYYSGGTSPYEISVALSGFTSVSGNSYGMTRTIATLGDSAGYTLTANLLSADTVIKLNTVDYLVPGDVLQTVTGTEFTIEDIDTERLEVILGSEAGSDVNSGEILYLNQDSKETLIFQEAQALVDEAVKPYKADLSRLGSPTSSTPVLSWLPIRNGAQLLRGVSDIEPTLTNLKIIGTGNASYTGSPSAGWTEGTIGTRIVDWTTQQTAAPSSLMPDTTPANAPMMGSRNRIYGNWKNTNPVNLDSSWNQITPTYDSALIYPSVIMAHDYSQLRRIICTNPGSGTSSLSETRWSGSAWSGATVAAWPIASWFPISMVPMIGTNATTGPVAPQGKALLALCVSPFGGAYELQLAFAAGGFYRLSVTLDCEGAKLRTTPWGVYLVGAKGLYGKVTFSGSALAMTPVYLGAALIPSTFCATSATDVYCMGRLTTAPDLQGKTITEVHLFKLHATPAAGTVMLLRDEKVQVGIPRLGSVVRDPSNAARIVGLFGNRMFQISASLPTTIERVRAIGMNGGELVEHVAQALNAMVVTLPTGKLQLVGRTQTGTYTAVTVDRTKVTQTRLSENFFSVVRVSGAKDDIYQDAWGITKGGKALEIDSQPCIWTDGAAFAMASAYAEFFGVPRRKEVQSWFSEDPNAVPAWEALAPWQIIRPTGSSRDWFLMGLTYNLVKGDAEATLLEKV